MSWIDCWLETSSGATMCGNTTTSLNGSTGRCVGSSCADVSVLMTSCSSLFSVASTILYIRGRLCLACSGLYRVVALLACLFDNDGERRVLGLLRLRQFDVQKTILELRPNAAAIHRTGDDDPPLKRAIINFHLAERAALLAARVFSMSAPQQQAVVQGDFEVLFLNTRNLHFYDKALGRLVNIRIGGPGAVGSQGWQAQIGKTVM